MNIARAKIEEALRERGQDIRADWVVRELPDVVDTTKHGGLLSMLNLDPKLLGEEPST